MPSAFGPRLRHPILPVLALALAGLAALLTLALGRDRARAATADGSGHDEPLATVAASCPGTPSADAAIEGCGLLLDGLRFVTWDRASISIEVALAPARLVFAGAPRRSEPNPQSAITVWQRNPEGVWHAWGADAPPGVPRLNQFERGGQYAVLSSTPVAWSLPVASAGASIFATGQVVSYYGYPGVPTMGILGEYEAAEVMRQATVQAAAYDALNGDRTVTPALHLITAVAQASPGFDGTYLGRLPLSTVRAYADAAAAQGGLLIIDIQIGWSNPLVEVRGYEEALLLPNVHVALDPEFATRRKGDPPGEAIGSVTGDEVNAVQQYLSDLVRARHLPPKTLVVHQFRWDMILDPYRMAAYPGVDLVIDMDGWGYQGAKLSGYEAYARAPYAPRPGFKLFFRWDTPLLTPEQIQALPKPPDLIIYQ